MKHAYYATRLAPDSHRSVTPEGYLIALGVPLARTGWQAYSGQEVDDPSVDRVQVYRSAEEVFSPKTMASFEGKTVVSPHPPVFLDPNNDSGYYKGHVQNVRRGPRLPDGNESLIGDVHVKDVQLINRLNNGGIAEISAGYVCRYVKQSDGTYAQVDIVGNHVAIVPNGRAGSHVRVLDSAEEESLDPVVDVEKTVGVIETVGNFLRSHGWLDPKQVKDAESEAVARNKKADEEANNTHSLTEDKEADMDGKEVKDAIETMRKQTEDAVAAGVASGVKSAMESFGTAFFEKFSPVMDKVTTAIDKRAKDDKEDEEEEQEMEDADLIPVATLAESDRPRNPIPGADKKALDALLALKPFIAQSGNDSLKHQFNQAVRDAKGGKVKASDAYSALAVAAGTKTTDASENTELSPEEKRAHESKVNFLDTAKQYHRQNPNTVVLKEAN